jgi:exonuclease SbcC
MLTSYPRIYSLSTLGIIYHFNSDYRFHSLRTDFSGEGGSGKTMIADIIQLILVGSSVYKSATEANEDRPAEGMVLKPKNSQYGAGYIVLNIETNPGKFMAIGAFIEKSSKQVRMFIGQSGYNWEDQLEPLSKPLFYKELLVDEKIVPIEDLQHKLQNVHIKTLPIKQYHRLLYNNNILPIDLSENKKTLDSYASIFRSFSRGSGFKKDSNSLKIFLFGDDQKHFLEKYQTEVKSISDDYQEHDRYKKEISLINQKQTFIKDVVALEKKYKKLKSDYLTSKLLYWNDQHIKAKSAFEKAKNIFDKIQIEEACINIKEIESLLKDVNEHANKYKLSKEALISISSKKKLIQKEKAEKYLILQALESKQTKIKLIDKFLTENGKDLDKVKQQYEKESIYKENKALLESFISHLTERQILNSFEKSPWSNDFINTKNKFDKQIAETKQKRDELKSLFDFSDLQNPDSLASWALKHFNQPLSIEQESVLRYFQKFPRHKTDFDRYISSPKELFENLDIKDQDQSGFWLNIDGVYEYIANVSVQYLNITEKEKQKLESQLAALSKDLKAEYSTLDQEIEQRVLLKETLFEFPGLEKAIYLYLKKGDFKRNPNTEYTSIEKSEFNECINLYTNKIEIGNEYDHAKKNYDDLVLSENNVDPNNFEHQLSYAKQFFTDLGVNAEETGEYISKTQNRLKEQQRLLKQLQGKLQLEDTVVSQVQKNLFANVKTYNAVIQLKASHYKGFVESKAEYDNKENLLRNCSDNLEASKLDYQAVFRKSFDFSKMETNTPQNPDEGANSLKTQYESAKVTYEAKYNLVTQEIEGGEQLIGSFHTGQLAHKLLPTVFITSVLEDEEQLNNQLAERLNKLYQTIREIGSRKIEILKRVFTEVNKTYREYLEKVNKIDQYFKNPNKVITGGNKASLKYIPSIDYPAKWMTVFNKILDDQVNYVGLFEQLSEEIDINQMMKKAFINENGIKEAEIDDLLDPKSYFDLTFELKLENGDNNSGSNSQTYSGNALLGLARLSLIGDEKRKGIRIMPIDEAQGLGSNYEMLKSIAIEETYQILTMSIETAGNINEGEQYVYILSENKLLDEDNYVPAMGIFSEDIITANISEFIDGEGN